jgi:hypothetical protein
MNWFILILIVGLLGIIYSIFKRNKVITVPLSDDHLKLISELTDQDANTEFDLTDEQIEVLNHVVKNCSNKEVDLTKDQCDLLLYLLKTKMSQIENKRQEIINREAKEGKKVPLSGLLDKLEKDKESHKGDELYINAIDRQIAELKEKYHIGVDEHC